jgi:hypothetical protein
MGVPFSFAPYNLPEVVDALEAMKRAGQESMRILSLCRGMVADRDRPRLDYPFIKNEAKFGPIRCVTW